MKEEIRILKEIVDNNDLDNYTIDDDECYLNGYARRCLKKVLEHYEILQEDNNNIRKALKTYEKGKYQEHLENEQLHSIIKEVREYINEDKNCVPKHIKEYFKDLLDKVGEQDESTSNSK